MKNKIILEKRANVSRLQIDNYIVIPNSHFTTSILIYIIGEQLKNKILTVLQLIGGLKTIKKFEELDKKGNYKELDKVMNFAYAYERLFVISWKDKKYVDVLELVVDEKICLKNLYDAYQILFDQVEFFKENGFFSENLFNNSRDLQKKTRDN